MQKTRTLKILAIFIFILLFIFRDRVFPFKTLEEFIAFIEYIDNIPFSSLIFIFIGVVSSLFFFPISWIKVTGAIIFGFRLGVLYNIITVLVSAFLAFTMSRYLFKDSIQAWVEKTSKKNFNQKQLDILKSTENPSFRYIFILRNIYFISFTFLNYTLGVSKTSLKTFLTSTFFATIPGTTIVTYLFSQSIEVMNEPEKLIIPFILVSIYYLTLFLLNKKIYKV